MLVAAYVHPSRKARQHLWGLAASNSIAKKRVDEVLGLVGLSKVSNHRVKTYSLGMKQRLGIAAALLGDPHTMILDEPGDGPIPRASAGSATFSLTSPSRTGPCSCPAICCRRWR